MGSVQEVERAQASILHYAVEGRLGAGGMGVVYRAVDTRLGRPVALKFLPDDADVGADAKRRLVLEARAAAQLDHPNVGVIYGIEEVDGRTFIAMALYEGQTLEDRLATGPVPAREAGALCLQAARGLAHAHGQGLVHRDIKPANLFLTRDGLVKILDFGLAKHGEEGEGLTAPGTLVGTAAYMAPEQVRGVPADRRVDLWALGVVLYELLTGVSPFRADGGVAATVFRVMSATPPPLIDLDLDLPFAFQDALDRAMAKDPDERFDSAEEMARALEDALGALAGDGPVPARDRAPAQGDASFGAVPGDLRTRVATTTSTASIVDLTLAGHAASGASVLLEPVPRPARFVGRAATLEALGARLAADGMVAVRGLAGSGKTALAATLVRGAFAEERICWFTFDAIEKQHVDALYWSVAAFLGQQGDPLLWRYLQGEIEAHRPLDRTVRLNLFLSSLAASDCAFCFDDVQLVAAQPEAAELFKAVQRRVSGSAGARIVVVGRDLPADLEHVSESLGGLTPDEVTGLIAAHGVDMPAALATRLGERTHGNPTLLELALATLRRMEGDADAMDEFVRSMAGRADIRDYVVNHIYAALPDDERTVLDAMSIFAGPVELAVAEETLVQGGVTVPVARCVDALIQKAVLHEGERGAIACHDLVREHAYRMLDGRTKRALHGLAAAHFETTKQHLRAAHHALEGGDAERALALLTANVRPIIEAGGSSRLLELLPRFEALDLDDAQRLALVLARGEALTVTGAYRALEELYRAALDDLFDDEAQAALWCGLASTANSTGDHDAAVEHAGRALEAYGLVDDVAGQAQVQRVLGAAHYRSGRLEEARGAFEAGLAAAASVEDASLEAYLDLYLGAVDRGQGRLDEARDRFERGRRAFRTLRDRIGEAEALGNLAVLDGMAGRSDREHAMLIKVLEILEQVGDVGNLLIVYNNLGDVERRAGRFDAALEHYARLVELASRLDHTPWSGGGRVGLAEVHLARGDVAAALKEAKEAHDLLDALDDEMGTVERAMSQRVLGEVYLASGDPAQARAWFERSLEPLEDAHETEELAKARRGLEATIALLGTSGSSVPSGPASP